ncbi:MAG: glutamate formimidoyltransferase [Chloroflexota bacterium]
MDKIVQCIPNFSEGRRRWVVDEIVAAVRSVDTVSLLAVEPDSDHNRTVVAFAGPPAATLEAAFRAVRRAADIIDLRQHQGAHPRVGATDVVPFVPLAGVTMAECVALARALGERVAREMGIPVYLYGEAATRPERRDLPYIRKGEFEGLKEAIESDPDRAPDFGPAKLGPAGATVVGARWPLIAYNVNLRTSDLGVAKAIARKVREAGGGLPGVRALGLALAETGLVQVSMDLVDYHKTGMLAAFTAVRDEARQLGVEVDSSQIVGLVPAEALVELVAAGLQAPGFGGRQIVERAILAGAEEGKE